MDKKTKLLYGVAINDADYVPSKCETIGYINGKQKRKLVWSCPFYVKWNSMLARCYSEKSKVRNPTYQGCYVIEEWLTFSNFKSWMEQQDWEGKQLDKDLLSPGNKEYGPKTCVFVDAKVNTFTTERAARRGEYPIGVSFSKQDGKFNAMCRSVTTGKQEYLGMFKTAEEAHSAWLIFKLEQAYILAAEQNDEMVAKALIDRYENYNKAA